MNVLNILKNHWKKSVCAVAASAYGASYLNGKWKDWKLMQAYCFEAKKYGDFMLKSSNRPKRVTVILNPAANRGNGKSVYEKNVAPILHLAGMEVDLIITKHEGQAKKLMGEIENADAIIVAGGDGTLSEAVTGFMRRSDESKLSSIPWCVIPLGKTNSLARSLYLPTIDNTVQFIAEMAFSSINGPTEPVDVMHIKGNDKSVYAVSNLSIGAFTDSEIRKKKNWYFGPLKDRLCYVVTVLRYWTGFTDCHVTYSLSCSGCNQCKAVPPAPQWSWWHIFVRPKQEPIKDYTNVQNDFCGKEFETSNNFAQMDLVTNKKRPIANIGTADIGNNVSNNINPTNLGEQGKSIDVKVIPSNINRTDFIQKGWERMKSPKEQEVSTDEEPILEVGTIKLDFPNMEKSKMFLIDSEQFEGMKTLSIQLLPNKFNFYSCPKTRVVNPTS